ncbi:hypothetical protein ONZ45_g13182 [Pleurotus djamor]|nr:hypothetical protein ONZ45_g13182 [Pleurotus djamor]
MSTTLRDFIGRLFAGRKPAYTTSLLGLDCGGKTTLLYKIKTGNVVQTIPSIGFNVEDVSCPTLDGQSLHTTMWDIGLGCGGITYMARMISFWIENTNAIVWVVDSADKERLEESVTMMSFLLTTTNFQNTVPVLVLANKRDLPTAMPLDAIRQAFAPALSGRPFAVFQCSCLEDYQKSGLSEAFYWLKLVLESPNALSLHAQIPGQPTGQLVNSDGIARPTADALADKLESWVSRALSDEPADAFIEKFDSLSLPSWDHYTHIRIAYVLLTKYGRQQGKDMIFDGIERYIRESPQTTGRTFHFTMTYFWVQLVHFGIQSMPKDETSSMIVSPRDSQITLVTPASDVAEFARFLVLNPYVVDGSAWSNYYTKEVLMSPGAKAAMVLPDKKPLPNLVSRDVV